ncbi:MAG TPA: response regulator [Terriglobales bacterium]|jgi:CheY-like chemotaxis protein|nr:response regulator [Terriglobales bacterium]
MSSGKVLCIDDDELGLMVRRLTLEAEGFEVATAANGAKGLELLAASPFDVVLLDHSMPGMNGGEVAQQIRSNYPGIPIVFLSAYITLPEEHLELVDAYITKGDSTEALLATIKRFV